MKRFYVQADRIDLRESMLLFGIPAKRWLLVRA